VLHVGRHLLSINAAAVVSGLPTATIASAAAELCAAGPPVWLRTDSRGAPVAGVREDRAAEVPLTGLNVVAPADEEPGVLARSDDSLALYFLPAAHAGWAALSADVLRRHCLGPLPKGVVGRRDGIVSSVSLIGRTEVRRQLAALQPGDEITVTALSQDSAKPGEPKTVLARAFGIDILLSLQMDGIQTRKGETIACEIVSVSGEKRPSVLVVASGRRRLVLDLPLWMLRGDRRTAHQRWLDWREQPIPVELPESELDRETALELQMWRAFRQLHPFTTPDAQAQAAMDWVLHFNSREMSLPFALMAVLVLERAAARVRRGDAASADAHSRVAAALVVDLGRRALRSRHAEVLSRSWLGNPAVRERHDSLWLRLNLLAASIPGPHTAETLRPLRQFCDAAELLQQRTYRIVAQALSAAFGSIQRGDALIEAASTCTELITLGRTIDSSRLAGPLLTDREIKRVASILEDLSKRTADITLLVAHQPRPMTSA
jgi:hypothetical protein